jgi:hypothetical protein
MPRHDKHRDKNPTEELLDAAREAVKDYEAYLMDNVGWRELAQTMEVLREKILAYESKIQSR